MWKVSKKKNQKQQQRNLPPPPVVSTYCSSNIKPRLFLHNLLFRRSTPNSRPKTPPSPSPSPAKTSSSNSLLAKEYWEKIRRLEQELADLDKWLNSSVRNNEGNIDEIVSLKDGNYIKKVRRGLMNKKSQELAIQISVPVSVEEVTTISEVLMSMASMGMDTLIETLIETIPLSNITGCMIDDIRRKSTTRKEVTEVIIGDAMEMIEELAMEGLKINQTTSNRHKRIVPDDTKKKKKDLHQVTVHVMLIQIRDVINHFVEVGNPMIALVALSNGTGDRKETKVEDVCVAGLTFDDDFEDDGFIWSFSWMDSDNLHRFLRNHDIVCPKKY